MENQVNYIKLKKLVFGNFVFKINKSVVVDIVSIKRARSIDDPMLKLLIPHKTSSHLINGQVYERKKRVPYRAEL